MALKEGVLTVNLGARRYFWFTYARMHPQTAQAFKALGRLKTRFFILKICFWRRKGSCVKTEQTNRQNAFDLSHEHNRAGGAKKAAW